MSEEPRLTDRVINTERNLEEIKQLLMQMPKKKWGPKMKWLLGKAKLKKGYIKVLEIGENKEFNFRKEPIIDSTILLNDTIHVVTAKEIHTHRGKPAIIQYKGRMVAYDPENEKNETYGHKYVISRMHTEALKLKKAIGAIGWWIFILAVGGAVAYYFMK